MDSQRNGCRPRRIRGCSKTLKTILVEGVLKLREKRKLGAVADLSRPNPPDSVGGRNGRVYEGKSLGFLRPADLPRRIAIFIVESRFFDPFILFTIMCNCATMAWESPLDPVGTWKSHFIAVCEDIYRIIFTFELLAKVVAYGLLLNSQSYLRDAWCLLDLVVVSLAWLPVIFPTMGNFSVIRSVRALRPLRALKRVPGMPKLIGAILQVSHVHECDSFYPSSIGTRMLSQRCTRTADRSAAQLE